MGLLLALTAVAGIAAGANAQCVSLADAASAAGLTGILDVVGGVAELEAAAPLLALASAEEPVDTPVTLFVPSNEAFAEIADVASGLDPELILVVLLSHVVPTPEDAATLIGTAPASIPTLLGANLETSLDGEDLIVTPEGTTIAAKVITTDVETCAGIVHVVDKVLIPVVENAGAATAPTAAAPAAATPVAEFETREVVVPVSEHPVAEPPVEFVGEDFGAYGEVEAGAYGEVEAGAYGI